MKRSVRYLWYLFAFLLTLEVCVRAEETLRWGAPFWGPYSFDTLIVDDGLGGRNRPYARFEKWAINGQGFQGPELRVPKPKGIARIGVAGASEIFGLYESPGCDITSRLRGMLEKAMPGKFEVVNLATPGMSIPRIVELHERWIRKFDFDAIIYYPSPAMYLDGRAPEFRGLDSGQTPRGSGTDTAGWSLRLPRKTWEILRERLPSSFQVKLKWYQIERKRRNLPPGQIWTGTAPDERVKLFREHLKEFVTTLRKNGTRPIIATHANRFPNETANEHDPYMVGWIRFYPRASGASLLDMEYRANQVIRELGGQHHVIVADVESKVGKNPAYYSDFVHFTDSGAALAAETMRNSIVTMFARGNIIRGDE